MHPNTVPSNRRQLYLRKEAMKILKIFGIVAFLILVLTSSIAGFDNKSRNNTSLRNITKNTISESLFVIKLGKLLKSNALTCSRHSEKPIIAHKFKGNRLNSGFKI